MISLETFSYVELNALYRALLAAKFGGGHDLEVPSSPAVSTLIRTVCDSLVARDEAREGQVATVRWEQALSLGPDREEWKVAMEYAAEAWRPKWRGWSNQAKADAIGVLLSPHRCDAHTADVFARELEARMSTAGEDTRAFEPVLTVENASDRSVVLRCEGGGAPHELELGPGKRAGVQSAGGPIELVVEAGGKLSLIGATIRTV